MSDVRRQVPALARTHRGAPGRRSVMAVIGFAVGAVPIPFLPSAALKRVRGALAHDVAARYGLSLTDDAREEMSEPSRSAQNGAFLATLAFVARRTLRRFGVLGILAPLSAWLEVYALGLLFERYLDRVRSSQTVRIHGSEAKLVRKAIDAAISRALSPKLALGPSLRTNGPAEELRSFPTRVLDGVLLAAAAVPDHVRRRLEAAFDDVLDEGPLHV